MTVHARPLVAAFCLALIVALFGAAPALAQTEYSDAKLESFVQAAIKVENLMREYEPRVQAAESPQTADTLRAEARAKMEAAVVETPGISLAEYSRIVEETMKDQALNDRVDALYRTARGQ
jgi:hypothetical protein